MHNTIVVVGLGEVLWDIFPDKKILGGAPANFAYHMSQLGYNAFILSAVGEDSLGSEIILSLKEKHLNFLIETVNYPTGIVKVNVDVDGVPQYDILENVAWDNIPFNVKTDELAKVSRVVSFGSLVQRTESGKNMVEKYLCMMPENSLKIFDVNLRQNYYTQSLILNSLAQANILKVNNEELAIIISLLGYTALDEEVNCRRLLKEFNLRIVILTKGLAGSFIFTEEESSFQPTPKVEIVDTVGAGDSFTAGFIASYLKGNSIIEAHKFSVDISSYVCTQRGAMPLLPSKYKLF